MALDSAVSDGGHETHAALVLHEDALAAASQAASTSVDQLIWQGSPEVARAVTVLGPGIVVLPLFARLCGVAERESLTYAAHPKRAAKGGLMDRVDFESRFGQLDPGRLLEELRGGDAGLSARLRAMSNEELQDEVAALQDWRTKANGRLAVLERRAAWAFLGMPAGSASQAEIKKAFKRKALELHPDKGGDAERFQLLQQMKALLIVPTAKELEEQEKEKKEREQEVEKATAKDVNKAKVKGKEGGEEEDDDSAEFSSDDSWDANEELRKMFPKEKKRKHRRRPGDQDDLEGLGRGENFNREKHEAARWKLHGSFLEMWKRAGRLVDEIKRHQAPGASSEALRHLRKFVDRFASSELSKLTTSDPQKADRMFRRFLEQGSEVLCAAGAADPASAVAFVAMQVNCRLLSVAPSEDLQRRCSALLEAIEALPSVVGRFVLPVSQLADRPTQPGGLRVRFLLPEPSQDAGDPRATAASALAAPGVREEEVELAPHATLADLRAAAAHLCATGAVPRLFCGGRFLAGPGTARLTELHGVMAGRPVQCLPSNRAAAPRPLPLGGSEAPSRARPPAAKAPAPAVTPVTPPVTSSGLRDGGAPDARPAQAAVHRPTPQLLQAAGLSAGFAADPEAELSQPEKQGQDSDHTAASAAAPAVPATTNPDSSKATDEGEEDEWFDDFFAKAKPPAKAQACAAPQQPAVAAAKAAEPAKAPKEARQAQDGEEAEAARLEDERRQRRAVQEQGRSALEARLRAQKQAAEAKKQLERERRRGAGRPANGEGAPQTPAAPPGPSAPASPSRELPEPGRPMGERSQAVVALSEDPLERSLQRLRTAWSADWCHPCAGDKKLDGSAIFCCPCDSWVMVSAPYDHHAFELHSEKVGHYGWID